MRRWQCIFSAEQPNTVWLASPFLGGAASGRLKNVRSTHYGYARGSHCSVQTSTIEIIWVHQRQVGLQATRNGVLRLRNIKSIDELSSTELWICQDSRSELLEYSWWMTIALNRKWINWDMFLFYRWPKACTVLANICELLFFRQHARSSKCDRVRRRASNLKNTSASSKRIATIEQHRGMDCSSIVSDTGFWVDLRLEIAVLVRVLALRGLGLLGCKWRVPVSVSY